MAFKIELTFTNADIEAQAISTEEMRPYKIEPPAGAVQSISVVSQPTHGRAVVNADNTVTVVPPRGATGADTLQVMVSYSDATPDTTTEYQVTIAEGTTRGGFAQALSIPYFKEDVDGSFLIERPDAPREVFISKALGKSRADIAAERGLTEGDITYSWLENNHETYGYGLSEAEAVDPDVGGMLWSMSLFFGDTSGRKSPTLRFRAGETYLDTDGATFTNGDGGSEVMFPNGSRGPHARRPILVTRYGTGANPKLFIRAVSVSNAALWITLQKVDVDGGATLNHGYGMVFDSLQTEGEMNAGNWGAVCYHRINFWDCFKSEPKTLPTWNTPDVLLDSNTGFFSDGGSTSAAVGSANGYGYGSGVGVVHCSFETINFDPTYDPTVDTYPETSKPPTSRGHGIYFNAVIRDAVVMDSMFSRIALYAIWSRCGTSIVNCFFAANNNAIGAAMGNYGSFNGAGDAEHDWNGCIEVDATVTITESGGWGSVAANVGRENVAYWGFDVNGATMTNFAILNGAEPGDTAEYNRKNAFGNGVGLVTRGDRSGVAFGNDMINIEEDTYTGSEIVLWNWYQGEGNSGQGYEFSENLNPYSVADTTLNEATIMAWTDNELSTTGSKRDDFLALLRDSADPVEDHMDSLQQWFLTRAGYTYPTRTTAQTVVFQASDLTDGAHWMYRENWIGGDRPGGMPGRRVTDDSVDLAGYNTIFGLMSLEIVDLDLDAGALTVANGWLGSTGTTSCNGGSVKVGFTGWFEIDNCTDALSVHVEGLGIKWLFANSRVDETTEDIQGHGRFSATGTVSALALTVDWGEAVIKEGAAVTTTALTMTRRGGEIISGRAHTEVGMGGDVLFDGSAGGAASLILGGQTTVVADDTALPQIREGRSGEYAGAANVAPTLTLGGDLEIDLTNHLGDLSQTLFSADSVSGAFDAVTATGLGARDLTLTVGASSVTVDVVAGTGQVSIF